MHPGSFCVSTACQMITCGQTVIDPDDIVFDDYALIDQIGKSTDDATRLLEHASLTSLAMAPGTGPASVPEKQVLHGALLAMYPEELSRWLYKNNACTPGKKWNEGLWAISLLCRGMKVCPCRPCRFNCSAPRK